MNNGVQTYMWLMQLLSLRPPILLSDILESIMWDSELNNNLIRMHLTEFTKNNPLSFFSSVLGPFFGIVDMVVSHINSVTCPSSLILLHNFSNYSFRSCPMHEGLNISLEMPMGSLDFRDFILVRTLSRSSILNGLFLFLFDKSN